MADIFHEVEEELRKDKYNELLRKWGPMVLGGAVAIVLGVAAWEGWQYLQTRTANTYSDAYLAAMQDLEADRLSEAAFEFEDLTEDAPAGYAALSLLRRGDIALEQGDLEAAGRHYEQAAETFTISAFSDFARIKAGMALFDYLSLDDLENRLSPAMGLARPYRLLAAEVVAAKAFSIGDLDRALAEYELIANDLDGLGRPVSIRAQAAIEVIQRLQLEAGEAVNASQETSAGEAQAQQDPAFNLDATNSDDDQVAEESASDLIDELAPEAAGQLETDESNDDAN